MEEIDSFYDYVSRARLSLAVRFEVGAPGLAVQCLQRLPTFNDDTPYEFILRNQAYEHLEGAAMCVKFGCAQH